MKVLKSEERGFFENNWLKSYHSFSFGEYYNPDQMHFRDLRVINHDFVNGNTGFPTHPHRDMEIMTYVLKGTISHKDSMGNRAEIKAGEVQIMSAGTGITHSEFNDGAEKLELLQIWIIPEKVGIKPRYDQKKFTREEKLNTLKLIATRSPKDNALLINQDVNIYGTILEAGKSVTYTPTMGRGVWIQVAEGELEISGKTLVKGDAFFEDVTSADKIEIKASKESDFVLFDLA